MITIFDYFHVDSRSASVRILTVLTNIINENIKITKKKISNIEIKKTLGVMIIKNILYRSTIFVSFNENDHKKKKNEEKVDF